MLQQREEREALLAVDDRAITIGQRAATGGPGAAVPAAWKMSG